MAKTFLFSEFEPKSSHSYFLDANILLYGYAAIGDYQQDTQQKVTSFIEKCLRVGSCLIVTSMVISEFYNKNIKDAFVEWQQTQVHSQNLNFKKDFRKSEAFKLNNSAIQAALKSILKISSKFPDDFNSIDINEILENSTDADFNDAYFLSLAQKKEWMIITNDKDLIFHPNRNVDIITSLKI